MLCRQWQFQQLCLHFYKNPYVVQYQPNEDRAVGARQLVVLNLKRTRCLTNKFTPASAPCTLTIALHAPFEGIDRQGTCTCSC